MVIQVVFLVVVAFALGFTWRRVKQNALRRSEGLFWTLVWVAIGVVALQPEVANFLANLVGIGRGADLMVYGSIVVLFLLVFQLQIANERLEHSLTELVTRQALKQLDDHQG